MFQYICHYIRDLGEENPLSIPEIECIGLDHSTIRILWGGEYFDFSYEESTFHPIEGKPSLVYGRAPRLSIKSYSSQEFLELIKYAERLIAFSNPDSMIFTPKAGFKQFKPPNMDLFTWVQIHKFVDYSLVLADLEERGMVAIRSSQNLIATIDKKFQLYPKAAEHVLALQDYLDHFYEADCLGTNLHTDLTTCIEKLWRVTNQKVSPNTLKSSD